jgi:hypothetical protein
LTPIDFGDLQNDTFSKRTIGTGTWFIEHPTFQKWVSSEPSVLWLKGMRERWMCDSCYLG